MIDGRLFDKLVRTSTLSYHDRMPADFLRTQEYVARKLRKNELPFGGIQVRKVSSLKEHSLMVTEIARFVGRLLSASTSPRQALEWCTDSRLLCFRG